MEILNNNRVRSIRLTKPSGFGSLGRPAIINKRPSLRATDLNWMWTAGSPGGFEPDIDDIAVNEPHCDNPISALGKITFSAQYFNSIKKCWEPLLDKISAFLLYEEEVIITYLEIFLIFLIRVPIRGDLEWF